MSKKSKTNRPNWPEVLQRINSELTTLGKLERHWLKERLVVIEGLQLALNELFCKIDGVDACRGCDGTCCDCGLHHITLTNVLAYLLNDEEPPAPDFNNVCPYLGEQGCRLPVARRPYNCITFFCETLDNRLDSADREQLRTLDRQLRSEYQSVANRYPTASLRGLWIALERLGKGRLLSSSES